MMRKPLGRGLDALIENTVADSGPHGAGMMMLLRLEEISPGPYQPRTHFDQERLAELALAIKNQGVIEPLIVRSSGAAGAGQPRYELIAGERRLRAARLAGLNRVPAVLRKLDDRGALEMALVENLAREDLNAVEEGRALAKLHDDFGQSHEQIAARIGKSRPYVSNAIRLLDLTMPVVEMIEHGDLTPGQARPLLALGSAEAQLAAARGIVERGVNARGAEAIASEHRRARNGIAARVPSGDANLNALAEGLQRALKRKVRIVRRRGKQPGRIELDYYDENDLNALASILMGNGRPMAAHA